MMKTLSRAPSRRALLCVSTVAVALSAIVGASTTVGAAEAEAKQILKAMSDYVGAQKTISFDFDASLEVVTNEEQKLSLASSGTVALSRPGSIRATRAGGHADIEILYDGKTVTLLGKGTNPGDACEHGPASKMCGYTTCATRSHRWQLPRGRGCR